MSIKSVLESAGNAISNGAGQAVDAAKGAASAASHAVKKVVTRGKLAAEGAYASAMEWKGWVECEKFPPITYDDVTDNPGPPMAPNGAWASSGGPSMVSPAERSFLYLDCGRWGGSNFWPPQRDFGLVCGRTAVLCSFKFNGGTPPPLSNDLKRPEIEHINALLKQLGTGSLGAVTVRRWDVSRTQLPNNADTPADKIFVCLGDMHLPVITSMNDTFGKRFGRIPGATGSSGDMVVADAATWFTTYNGGDGSGNHDRAGGDIFEGAGADLTELMRLLSGFQSFPLHLIQCGDLVDLWLGFERFYLRDPASVVLDSSKSDPTATEWIDHWTDATLKNTTQSADVANLLGFSNGQKTWLYGNHDNYLARHNPDSLRSLSGNLDRQPNLDTGIMFVEHGHRWDSYNKDGAIMGQAITQAAFSAPVVRKLDPSARRDCILGAAGDFQKRETSNPFVVYVMGHTHCACLTRVVIRNNT